MLVNGGCGQARILRRRFCEGVSRECSATGVERRKHLADISDVFLAQFGVNGQGQALIGNALAHGKVAFAVA